MDCLSARRAILAEPQRADDALLTHCATCPACAKYRREILQLDLKLESALDTPVPACLAPRILMRQSLSSKNTHRWYLSAVLAACIVSLSLYALFERGPITADAWRAALSHHLDHLPHANADVSALTLHELNAILVPLGIRMDQEIGVVAFAEPCIVGGHTSAHLNIATNSGPVSVIVMPHGATLERLEIRENTYAGILVPCERGSIAVIGDAGAPLQALMRQLVDVTSYI